MAHAGLQFAVKPSGALDQSGVLWQLFREEVPARAVERLWPHLEFLVAVGEAIWQPYRAEERLRRLFRYLGELHLQLDAAYAAAQGSQLRSWELERHLQSEQQSSWANGYGRAMQSNWMDRALNAEHARANQAEAECRRLVAEVSFLAADHVNRGKELRQAEAKCAWAEASAEQAATAAGLNSVLRGEVEQQARQHMLQVVQAQSALQSKESEIIAARGATHAAHLETLLNVKSWSKSIEDAMSFLPPCAAELIRFMRTDGPLHAAARDGRVQLPVLAVRWAPGSVLDTAPSFQCLRMGALALLDRMQNGEVVPESPDCQLKVYAVDRRWFLADLKHAPRLGALLMYQALHLDIVVAPICLVQFAKALPEMRGFGPRDGYAVWTAGGQRPPPPWRDHGSAFLRFVIKGLPVEADVLQVLDRIDASSQLHY